MEKSDVGMHKKPKYEQVLGYIYIDRIYLLIKHGKNKESTMYMQRKCGLLRHQPKSTNLT